MTSGEKPQQILRVDMSDWEDVTKFAFYGSFSVGGEEDNFPLHVGMFSSRSSVSFNALSYSNSRPFTSIDRDNDVWSKYKSLN